MYIFIHIPKTAGTSLFEPNRNFIEYIGHIVETGNVDINTLGINKIKENKSDKIIFTIIRNPYTRFISAYNYLKNGGINTSLDLSYKKILDSISLDEFINLLDKYILEIIHFVPQYCYITCNNKIVNDIKIIKFENIDNELAEIGINNISKSNIGTVKYIEELTLEQKNKIYNIYCKDFLLFNYEK